MFKKSLIALALAVAATGSFAQVYVQGAIGLGNVNAAYAGAGATDTKTSSSGNKFLVGYGLGNNWSIEVNAIDYGKSITTVPTFPSAEFKVSGMGVGGAYTFDNPNSKWIFRIGLALNNNKVSTVTPTGSASESSTQANIDFGAGYKINKNITVIAGYDGSAGKYVGKNYSTSLLSVGIRANF